MPRPEHLIGVTIFHEDSPELGYASPADIQEFVAGEYATQDERQLFPTSDPVKIQRLADKVFKTMRHTAGIYYPAEDGKYYGYHHDDALGTDVFELGKQKTEPEQHFIINLDSYSRIIGIQHGGWYMPKVELPKRRQATPIIKNFVIGRIIAKHEEVDFTS